MESSLGKEAKWNDFTLRTKVRQLLGIEDTAGLVIQVALFTGMLEKDMSYLHRQQICNTTKCHCKNIHVIDNKIGLTVIFVRESDEFPKWYVGVIPTRLWKHFRDLRGFGIGDIGIANMVVNVTCGVRFDELHEIYINVIRNGMERSIAKLFDVPNILETSDLIWDSLHTIVTHYLSAWEQIDIILPMPSNL